MAAVELCSKEGMFGFVPSHFSMFGSHFPVCLLLKASVSINSLEGYIERFYRLICHVEYSVYLGV